MCTRLIRKHPLKQMLDTQQTTVAADVQDPFALNPLWRSLKLVRGPIRMIHFIWLTDTDTSCDNTSRRGSRLPQPALR